jgi:ketosteroid isomerase-like protein
MIVSVAQDLTPTVDAFYEGMERRDFAALRELLDPQVEWNSSENFLYAEHNPYVGVEMVLGILRQIDADWETFAIRTDETLVAADTVIVRGRYRGKFKGTGFGLDAEFVHVLRFREGKLLEGQSYTDTAQFRDAVRHLKRPGPPQRTGAGAGGAS